MEKRLERIGQDIRALRERRDWVFACVLAINTFPLSFCDKKGEYF